MSDSLQTHGLQHARLPCPSLSSGVCSNSCALSRDAIQPSHPLLSPSPPALILSQHQNLFQWVGSSHQVAQVLKLQLQHQSFQWIFRVDFLYNWLVWSPCCSKDSQEFSPAPQFESIHSSVLSLLYGPVLTSVGFPCGSAGKESTCNVGDLGLIPGLGRSPGEGKGYPLQYSGLENSMDYGVTKSWTELSDFHFTLLHFSHPYMTTGKTIALSRWTFVGKVTSLLFNMLSRFIIAFLPRSKHLLLSWLQSLSAVILKPMKIRFVTVSTFSPSICHEAMGPDANPVTISKLPTWYLGPLTMELLLCWLQDVTFKRSKENTMDLIFEMQQGF